MEKILTLEDGTTVRVIVAPKYCMAILENEIGFATGSFSTLNKITQSLLESACLCKALEDKKSWSEIGEILRNPFRVDVRAMTCSTAAYTRHPSMMIVSNLPIGSAVKAPAVTPQVAKQKTSILRRLKDKLKGL